MTYTPPINLLTYLLKHAVDWQALLQTEAHRDLSDELASDILGGAAAFASDVLAPLNRDGDQFGARLEAGKVTTAPGFKQAYQDFVGAGWQGLSAPAEIGGMGLPQTLGVMVAEMFYGANMAFGLCPMLTGSAINAIAAHANEEIKSAYLPKMVSGEWSGAMNLTEPQAGSDLGALRCKAVPNGDGSYALTGQKIFITWGEHDCAENIIHLVLARLPDAPQGSRGISLFLAPKILPDGTRNHVGAIGLEHKMGIHGSPTCVMEFDGATGFLIGAENRGLACMFTMMNEARLYVGVQGVGIGERAYQQALAYANERVQGRVDGAPPGTPILGHGDVKRMLLEMKTGLMGARVLNLATAWATDMSHCAQDEAMRKKMAARAALLTPLAKACGSDMGVKASSLGVQVHGGMGYIEETGAAQHYRDARIAPIYEGTNGIQALDFIGRKVRRDGGQAMAALMDELGLVLERARQLQSRDGIDLGDGITHLEAGLSAMRTANTRVLNAADSDVQAIAVPYLKLCADVVAGAYLLGAVLNGFEAGDAQAAHMQKLVWYYTLGVLAKAPQGLAQIMAGAQPIHAVSNQYLADL